MRWINMPPRAPAPQSSGTYASGNRALAVTGAPLFLTGRWWQEMARDISADPVYPNSAALIAASGHLYPYDFSTTTANGGNSLYGIPYNVVDVSQPRLPIHASMGWGGGDMDGSGNGHCPFFPSMSIEWWPGGPVPPTAAQIAGRDSHALVFVVSGGNLLKLCEGNGVSSEDGGATWQARGYFEWDLTTGAPLPLRQAEMSADAAGLAITPILVNYTEILTGAINHALRFTTNVMSGIGMVWPAFNTTGGNPGYRWPLDWPPAGSRIRMKADYDTSGLTGPVQIVCAALKKYGAFQADNAAASNIRLQGVNDERWTLTDLAQLDAIPGSAFEVVDFGAPTTLTGPTGGATGSPATFTITAVVPSSGLTANAGVYWNMYASASRNGAAGSQAGMAGSYNPASYNPSSLGPWTFTFTPPSDGCYVLTHDFGGYTWYWPAVVFCASTTPQAWTSQRGGDWSIDSSQPSSPWYDGGTQSGWARIPDKGDTVTINHDVTISATRGLTNGTRVTNNRTIGDGTSSTVLSVGVAGAGGHLTLIGATLTIRGNSAIGHHDGTYNLIERLTLQSYGSQPAGIIFDGNTGVAPVMTVEDNTVVKITGTSAARCFIRTKIAAKDGADSAGNPGRIVGDIFNYFNVFMDCQYADFTKLGDGSNPGISSPKCSDACAGSRFLWDHVAVDQCGTTPFLSITGGGANVSFTNCTWSNTTGGTATAAANIESQANLTGGGTRLLDTCVFLPGCRPSLRCDGLSITNDYFADFCGSYGAGAISSVVDGCFFGLASGASAALFYPGPPTNCYAYMTGTGWSMGIITCQMSSTGSHNVFEYAGSGQPSAIGSAGDELEAVPGSITYTWAYNIFINSGTGSWFTAMTHSSPNIALPKIASADWYHNTVMVKSQPATGGNNLQPNCMLGVRGNIFYNATPSSNDYAFVSEGPTQILDSLPAANVLANCTYNCSVVPDDEFLTGHPNAVTGATNCTNGTPYYSPMSGSTAPGAGDVVADPQFYDATRNLAAWGAYKGYADLADTMAHLRADTTLVKNDLLPWVRAGYRPTNVALREASYAGDTSTADANGNPWASATPGVPGTPGIGAMSY